MNQPNDPALVALLDYYHDCVAAQLNWSRAMNVVDQKDVELLGLTRRQQQELGRRGTLDLTDAAARDLAKQAAARGADGALTLGALFLCGRLPARGDGSARTICAPLLETPVSLDLQLARGCVVLQAEESELSINYGLLGELLGGELGGGDEDQLASRLAELAEITPDFPIDDEEFDTFFNGFLAAADELPIGAGRPARRGSGRSVKAKSRNYQTLRLCDFYVPRIADKLELLLLPAAAVVLGNRSGASQTVLTELQTAAAAPLANTALARLFAPAETNQRHGESTSAGPSAAAFAEGPAATHAPATDTTDAAERSSEFTELPLPMPLTDAQRAVVRSARTEPLTVVTGPPGTGKSYTITAIVLDALQSGRTVLVASQMDKAVEVVVAQVERLAGESSVARSGGRAAQRALAKKLQRLTGPRASRPPSIDDVSQARQTAEDLESALAVVEQRLCEMVERERHWSRLWQSSQRLEPGCPLPIRDLAPAKLQRATQSLTRAADASREGASWLSRCWGWLHLRRVRKVLQTPAGWECSIDELRELVEVQTLRHQREQLQRKLPPGFPADDLWEQARQLRSQRDAAVLEHVRLARRRQLADVTSDNSRRAQLRQLATLLRRRRRDLKRELRVGLDPLVLLWAFPVWACTTRSLGDVLPAAPELFDLVVIDEASQCDPATAAAALLRGRRAVVVGDPAQLRHVCFLSGAREQAAVARCQLPAADHQRFRYRRSLFDIAADAAPQSQFFLLTEHFRSHPQIIDFSNRQFYDEQLQVMTMRPSSAPRQAVRVHGVGGRRREGSSVNDAEVAAVVQRLRAWIEGAENGSAESGNGGGWMDRAGRPATLGVVSPFRDHVDAVREQVVAAFSAEQLARHAVVIGTAHSLQGDEKDVVVLTTSIDEHAHPASLRFLQRPNLFNVAVTRARHQLEVVTSVSTTTLPPGLLRSFLEHAASGWSTAAGDFSAPPPAAMAAAVEQRLSEHPLETWAQFFAAGETIDVAVAGDGRCAAVLLDDEFATADPLATHRRLDRAGWRITRLSDRSWQQDWHACVRHVADTLGD